MIRPKILFVKHYTNNTKFVLNDYEILKQNYDVTLYNTYTKKNFLIVFSLLKQFFYLLFNTHKFNLVFIWFGDYHSFFPVMLAKMFKKKSVIAIGGFDATDIPEIEMGAFNEDSFRKKMRSRFLRYSLKNADKLLVVDDSLIDNVNKYIFSDVPLKGPVKDGILNFIPGIKSKIEVVYTGFDEEFFKPDSGIPKENFVLTVGNSFNDNEFRRKGFDMLIETAKILPEIEFVLIGLNNEQIKDLSEKNYRNVKLISYVTMDELRTYYKRAKVYAQLSLFEGQPNSLCEAMMMECIPVGSDVNGIPRVIGDTGFIVYKKDKNEIAEKILLAMQSNSELGKKARKRIIDNFSLDRRRNKILSVARDLISG
ncbi:MAG: glycosyltransferase family 4 protein [Ignavibacteria bacterium]|nr:glycosyltransferase family 4 protein [Ignavibacteria bacterium]